jgi:hypothetical protein
VIGERERRELLGVLVSHFETAHTKSETTGEMISACQEYARTLTRSEAQDLIAEARAVAKERRRAKATPGRKAAAR